MDPNVGLPLVLLLIIALRCVRSYRLWRGE